MLFCKVSNEITGVTMNSVYADGTRTPSKTLSNKWMMVSFRLHFQSYTFAAGHTLRLSFSNGEWRAWNSFPVAFVTSLSCKESTISLPLLKSWPRNVLLNIPFTQVPVDNTDMNPPGVVFYPNVSSGMHVTINGTNSVKDIQFLSCALFIARNNFISTFYGMNFEQSVTDPANFT